MTKSTKQIADELSRAQEWSSNGETNHSGLSYEEGVEAALRWVLGEEDKTPIEKDYTDEN